MFKHILLPTDGSALSLRAAEVGIELAQKLGASVYVFHAMQPFTDFLAYTEILNLPEEVYAKAAKDGGIYCLNVVRERAKAAQVPCEGSCQYSERPYEAILQIAHEKQCDLIVMGSHGRSGLNRVLLGSQAQKLLHLADLPVLICR